MDPTARQGIADRLQQANNVLVTVKKNPDVDQLAACIGLTLFLNQLGKHATAVFSGDVPSTIDFLKPEETLEKNTDSLRDFIISLDKSKADKLRYKVEDKIVKIFITPYRTSLSEKDLDFSQGDFNVDVVVALGAESQADIDNAITAHGRILHDATVISITNSAAANKLGTLQLQDEHASSLCETLVELCEMLQADSFDAQMATAFLTGVVAKTERFSNAKTSPRTMTLSAKLMAAGANQQLIATQLQPQQVASGKLNLNKSEAEQSEDAGTLDIDHESDETEETSVSLPEPVDSNQEHEGEEGETETTEEPKPNDGESAAEPIDQPPSPIGDVRPDTSDKSAMQPEQSEKPDGRTRPLQPPQMGGTLTANTQPQHYEPTTDPMTNSQIGQTLQHGKPAVNADQTLEEIEEEVHKSAPDEKPAAEPATTPAQTETAVAETPSAADLDAARKAVEEAAVESQDTITPLKAVGSQPLDLDVQGHAAMAPTPPVETPPTATNNGATPDFLVDKGIPPEESASSTPSPAPPPVPPPMTPLI